MAISPFEELLKPLLRQSLARKRLLARVCARERACKLNAETPLGFDIPSRFYGRESAARTRSRHKRLYPLLRVSPVRRFLPENQYAADQWERPARWFPCISVLGNDLTVARSARVRGARDKLSILIFAGGQRRTCSSRLSAVPFSCRFHEEGLSSRPRPTCRLSARSARTRCQLRLC